MEDAQARRARLRALKEAAEILKQPEPEPGPEAEATQEDAGAPEDDHRAEGGEGDVLHGTQAGKQAGEPGEQLTVSFRNYIPRDEDLGKQKLPAAKVPKLKEPTPADATLLDTDDPITSIAPRKENWDLRRDVEKRLQKLERRTQRAMIQLMQEEEERRRQEEAGQGDEVAEEETED